jgi:hypothetical protein
MPLAQEAKSITLHFASAMQQAIPGRSKQQVWAAKHQSGRQLAQLQQLRLNAGGMFAQPGLERNLISALMLPVFGLQSILPVYSNNDTKPVVRHCHWQRQGYRDQPDWSLRPAEDCRPFHPLYPVGLLRPVLMKTPTIDITAIGKRPNRAVPMDLQIINAPQTTRATPSCPPCRQREAGIGGLIASEVSEDPFRVRVFPGRWNLPPSCTPATRRITRPAAATKSSTALTIWSIPARKDAVTQVLCPAADPSFTTSPAPISRAAPPTRPTSLNRMVYIYRNLKFKARNARVCGRSSGLVPCLTSCSTRFCSLALLLSDQ